MSILRKLLPSHKDAGLFAVSGLVASCLVAALVLSATVVSETCHADENPDRSRTIFVDRDSGSPRQIVKRCEKDSPRYSRGDLVPVATDNGHRGHDEVLQWYVVEDVAWPQAEDERGCWRGHSRFAQVVYLRKVNGPR